jgi:hemerythrin-like domain-containing protein
VSPIERFEQEHRSIEQALLTLERIANWSSPESAPDHRIVAQLLDYLVEFADLCHHEKEERLLFPLLERGFMSREIGPTACLRDEHVEARTLVERMAEHSREACRGLEASLEAFCDAARHYIALIRAHIDKEDRLIFPMARRLLDGETLSHLRVQCEAADLAFARRNLYLESAEELAQRYDLLVQRA